MRRFSVVTLVMGALLLVTAGPASAGPIELAQIPRCVQLVPAAISVDDAPATVDVRVLLDGVEPERGRAVFDTVRRSYAPQNIALATTFEQVSLSGDGASGLIRQSKERFGGARPSGADVVYTLTEKNITGPPPFARRVAGLADCIGGVAFAERAFAVGELVPDDDTALLDVIPTGDDASAKIAAHEIGHLLGAQHQYANCVEGLGSELRTELSACTLMFNTSSLGSLNFAGLNRLVVTGHAQQFARS